jgi:uncharacterized protein YndB with AHSA1/START domain
MDANLTPAGTRWKLEFRRQFPHPPEQVWRAITEAEHLRAWFPARIEGERKEGARLTFVFEDAGDGPTLEGDVLTYDPPRVFEFTWSDEILRFELTAVDGGTQLDFRNTFDDLGKAARDGAGWHVCLERLEYELAGESPPWPSAEAHWREVNAECQRRLGPEASTVGPPEGHKFEN